MLCCVVWSYSIVWCVVLPCKRRMLPRRRVCSYVRYIAVRPCRMSHVVPKQHAYPVTHPLCYLRYPPTCSTSYYSQAISNPCRPYEPMCNGLETCANQITTLHFFMSNFYTSAIYAYPTVFSTLHESCAVPCHAVSSHRSLRSLQLFDCFLQLPDLFFQLFRARPGSRCG